MNVAADNFLVPNGTFIVELIAFLIVVGVLAKWVFPVVNRAATDRQERIRKQFQDADDAKQRAEAQEKEYQDAVTRMRAEATELREKARAEGEEIVAEARTRAREEAERIARSAQENLEAQRQQIVGQMRAEVGRLAADLSSRIVGESLDDERQHRIIDRFLSNLESDEGSSTRVGG